MPDSVQPASLVSFFSPNSICLIGASSKEKSIGYEILKSILNYGYKGKIFPVNPNADYILETQVFKSIDELPEYIELAIILLPKHLVEDAIDELLLKKIKAFILISAGFKEAGTDGEKLEKKIAEKIKTAGARMVGPNCMGLINTCSSTKLNATFAAEIPQAGQTAFLSQSGAIGAAILNSLKESDIKFAHFISVGNKADINENDLLDFWQNDPAIKVITFYLESFSCGEEFIRLIQNNDYKKPLIILKAGKSEAGIKAASSHTGAIASNDKVVDAVFKQFSIIRAKDLNELFNTAKGFENLPLPEGNKIAVVTNAGGPAILAVDALEEKGLRLAELSEATLTNLKNIVHPEGSIKNPVDLLPGGTAEQFALVNEILLKDENVDAVVSVFVEPVMISAFDVIESINNIENNKPIFQVVMPLPEFWDKYRSESKTKKLLFKNPEDPAAVLANMVSYSSAIKIKDRISAADSPPYKVNETGFLSSQSIKELTEYYKIPFIDSRIIKPKMLIKFIDDFKYPLVLKGISQNVTHKSELNGVKVNIKNKEELLGAEMKIFNSFKEAGVPLDEFMIQPYVEAKHELLIGGFRDPSFGPMIMFGLGGKYVEVFNDISMKSAYICDSDIREMILETKIGSILSGVRGESPFKINRIIELIRTCAQMMLDQKNIKEFDINPLIIGNDNSLYAVDVRVKTEAI